MVGQFQDCYLSFTGTHWNVDVALGCSRTRWEKGGEREERLERAGMLYSNYRLFAEVVCLSDKKIPVHRLLLVCSKHRIKNQNLLYANQATSFQASKEKRPEPLWNVGPLVPKLRQN